MEKIEDIYNWMNETKRIKCPYCRNNLITKVHIGSDCHKCHGEYQEALKKLGNEIQNLKDEIQNLKYRIRCNSLDCKHYNEHKGICNAKICIDDEGTCITYKPVTK